MYYSQIDQDKYYIENIVKFKKNGFFLDIGAHDGLYTSNTATLELEYGWQGICVEANPFLINSLKQNRPNSVIYNVAVWNSVKEIEFEIPNKTFKKNKPGNLLSRITNVPKLDERNKNYFEKQFEEDTTIVKVQSNTITNIIAESVQLPIIIDYMSLDTEGAEIEALESIDFDQIDIRFMTIEHGNRPGYKDKFIEYLKPYGYNTHRINKWDIEFEK